MICWLCGFETTELVINAQVPTCNNHPCEICMAVANVDEEINQAVATLRRLILKRCDLRSEQNRIHGSLIHRLPVELSNYIFEPVQLTDSSPWRFKRPTAITKPSHLTFICRSWRDIAWSNPSLWSTLSIVLGKSDPSSWINFVHDRILLSRTLPLTLLIQIADNSKEGLERALKGMAPAFNAYHRVRRLKIGSLYRWHYVDRSVPLFHPNMSPETIEIAGVAPQSLQISWNNLTSANIVDVDFEGIAQLFQHALQMTCCQITSPTSHAFPPTPIVHHMLQTLGLHARYNEDPEEVATLLGSLTLPCLQEFHTNRSIFLTPAYLPALMHRSSCPLTSISLFNSDRNSETLHDLQPLPGVTDLILGSPRIAMRKLLQEYFPDLRHLTIQLSDLDRLWKNGTIPKLINHSNRPRYHTPHDVRLDEILVMDRQQRLDRTGVLNYVRTRLKELQSNIILKEDGFEILIQGLGPLSLEHR